MCEVHKKEYETFCFDCKGLDEPFCSICICEHDLKHHNRNIVHVSKIIMDTMKKMENLNETTEKAQEKVLKCEAKAEKLLKSKEEVRVELEEKLRKAEEFIKQQTELAKQNNANIALIHDSTIDEIRKVDKKLQDVAAHPKELDQKVKAMEVSHKYWKVYEELKSVSAGSDKIETESIERELAKGEQILAKYKEQHSIIDKMLDKQNGYDSLVVENKKLSEESNTIKRNE